MTSLGSPVEVAGLRAPSRVLFGPHETNLARGRAMSERHVAYYERRAAGGAGLVVTETASVHDSDWPYERAPLAALCGPGWRSIADACRPHGTLVLAGLGHAGSQGSSAYSQSALWAPSRVPDVASRELPVELEPAQIAEVVAGFRDAAALARESGMDGAEIDAGQYSLLRQFLSGLTNLRDDGYGQDRTRLLREVLGAVRGQVRILGLRLSCDELAPWAGITPERGVAIAREVAGLVDYIVPVRGSGLRPSATRPGPHTEPGFNAGLCRMVREAAGTAIVLQGSVVDPGQANRALDTGVADIVEMTRAQIADPDLVAKVRSGTAPRPCVLSNQKCLVRDVRNPIVACLAEPRSGHETEDPDPQGVDRPRDVLIAGGGPAGLEAARVLASRGHRVELVERSERLGGMLRVIATLTGRFHLLADWLEGEVRRLGVRIRTGTEASGADIVATGSVPGPRNYRVASGTVVDVVDVLSGTRLPAGPVVVADPVGDHVGAEVAELLAVHRELVTIVSQDLVIGKQLSLTGDLADTNARLQRAGVRLAKRSRLREVHDGHVVIEDVYTGERREIECGAVVHCGHRLPDDSVRGGITAGDRVAPRTVHEAILEGRRAALALCRESAFA
ncbi:MAG TPA: mycofactocin system FadH/OYE family oxidoreductase 1 [Amycolatopsis sp.]|nr:mycofactocin system FadH/OYE family oxidoreductase 1 [Amycolatopsis sp.]